MALSCMACAKAPILLNQWGNCRLRRIAATPNSQQQPSTDFWRCFNRSAAATAASQPTNGTAVAQLRCSTYNVVYYLHGVHVAGHVGCCSGPPACGLCNGFQTHMEKWHANAMMLVLFYIIQTFWKFEYIRAKLRNGGADETKDNADDGDDDLDLTNEEDEDTCKYSWSAWSPCVVTCGDGIKVRHRIIIGLSNCTAETVQTRRCSSKPCAEDLFPQQKNVVEENDQPGEGEDTSNTANSHDHVNQDYQDEGSNTHYTHAFDEDVTVENDDDTSWSKTDRNDYKSKPSEQHEHRHEPNDESKNNEKSGRETREEQTFRRPLGSYDESHSEGGFASGSEDQSYSRGRDRFDSYGSSDGFVQDEEIVDDTKINEGTRKTFKKDHDEKERSKTQDRPNTNSKSKEKSAHIDSDTHEKNCKKCDEKDDKNEEAYDRDDPKRNDRTKDREDRNDKKQQNSEKHDEKSSRQNRDTNRQDDGGDNVDDDGDGDDDDGNDEDGDREWEEDDQEQDQEQDDLDDNDDASGKRKRRKKRKKKRPVSKNGTGNNSRDTSNKDSEKKLVRPTRVSEYPAENANVNPSISTIEPPATSTYSISDSATNIDSISMSEALEKST